MDIVERPASPPSDESLVTAAIAGDHAAFGELVRRYERPVRAVSLAILRDHHLACDAAQDAFVTAYRSLAALRDRTAFGAWLTTIARNGAIRSAKNCRHELPLSQSLHQSTPGQNDLELLEAVAALPEQERIAVMLRYFEHHEISAISAILAKPIGTVTKQLSRARERLRRALTRKDLP